MHLTFTYKNEQTRVFDQGLLKTSELLIIQNAYVRQSSVERKLKIIPNLL